MELAFIHLANDSVFNRIEKINQYTESEIEKKKDRNYGIGALFYRPFVRFLELTFRKVVSVME